MNEADPGISWRNLFDQLKCCDPHPPLHFISTRLAFTLFGHTEYVARAVSAIAGTVSIAVLYLLGKELSNKTGGLIAAALTCVNYYNIHYSQEARMYILAFLFAGLSYLFFIKLIKDPGQRNAVIYAVCTLALLYSHYYSLFVMVSQGVTGLVILGTLTKTERGRLFRSFLLSGLIIALVYVPWLPFLRATMNVQSFWITNTDHHFVVNYFNEYFGNDKVLQPILTLLLVLYVTGVVISQSRNPHLPLRNDRHAFGLLLLLSWIFITMLIPYIRSVLVFPMLYPRYGIVVLPAVILALSLGIQVFKRRVLIYFVVILVLGISLFHLIAVRKYYSSPAKSQFREMTKFIIDNNEKNYPILNGLTHWHQAYYLKHYGIAPRTLTGKKEAVIDSILKKTSTQYMLDGFWLAGSHGDPKPADSSLRNLDTVYTMVSKRDFYDAWAMLYIKNDSKEFIKINYSDFTGGDLIPSEQVIALWGGSLISKPIVLPAGKYKLAITARGDPSAGEFPHIVVMMNDKPTGDYYVEKDMKQQDFFVESSGTEPFVIKIKMTNDHYIPGKSDRNVYVSQLVFERIGEK